MKQYTNAYRRIPVYAYQFMAGPAALEAPVGGVGAACGLRIPAWTGPGTRANCGVAGGV